MEVNEYYGDHNYAQFNLRNINIAHLRVGRREKLCHQNSYFTTGRD